LKPVRHDRTLTSTTTESTARHRRSARRRARIAPLTLTGALLVLVAAGPVLSSTTAGSADAGDASGNTALVAATATLNGTATTRSAAPTTSASSIAKKPTAPKPTATKPAPSTQPPASTLKAPISGLIDRHHAPKSTHSGVVRAFVVNTTWAKLQPQQGGPIVHPNDIDRAIDVARSNGFTLKLRVRSGIDAPEWAKRLDGSPVPFYYSAATAGKAGTFAGTVGRFWTPKFGAAYDDLQNKLAAEYDGVPEIRQTDITRCGTIFEETYLRDTMNKANPKALVAAGFTRAADDVCHNEQIASHRVWKRTLSDLSMNPYTAIAADGSVKQDMPYTLAQMSYCRQVLGARCVLENHSLSYDRITNTNYSAIYAEMKRLGGPFAFQTATAAKIGDASATLKWAASYGASSVELPAGYQTWSISGLQTVDSQLVANVSRG
jgi:hypothetical protein